MARNAERPVATGLLALAGVGLAVGILVSAAVLAGTRVLGLGDDGGGSGGSTPAARESMYLPTPEPTPSATGPAVTLAPVPGPGEEAGGAIETTAPPAAGATPTAPSTAITLSTTVSSVGPSQEIPLDGTYPAGEGAVLQVERFTNDTWTTFPVDVTVRSGTFSTYIRTSQTGETRFRLRDTASGATSNEITVTIG